MVDNAHGEALTNVARQLAAIAAIRRRLVRDLPHEMGNGSMALAALSHLGEIRLRELAHHLDCDLSVVSRQVASLEKRGTVERRVNPQDRRSSLVRVTPEGRALVDTLFKAHTDLLAEAMADWTHDELDQLTTALERLKDGLSRHVQGAAAFGPTDGVPSRAHPSDTPLPGPSQAGHPV